MNATHKTSIHSEALTFGERVPPKAITGVVVKPPGIVATQEEFNTTLIRVDLTCVGEAHVGASPVPVADSQVKVLGGGVKGTFERVPDHIGRVSRNGSDTESRRDYRDDDSSSCFFS
nr:hypothetical protein [Amycolatopsis panacis]